MNWTIYIFGSGAAFFIGIGCILAALASMMIYRGDGPRIMATLAAFLGLCLIALSATPMPTWFYAAAFGVTVAWLAAERAMLTWLQSHRNCLRIATGIIWMIAGAIELPYHFMPTIPNAGHRPLFIIGDSVAAGLGGHDTQTWPHLLASDYALDVSDFSRVGATAASAMKQAEELPADGGIVILEIGGNDMLGTTSPSDFHRNLGRLLNRVCAPGRVVVMFELPLMPFCNDFGRAQRRLAAEYGVYLIPKRVFAEVLTEDDSTLDSIHLSLAGHKRMAEVAWSLVGTK